MGLITARLKLTFLYHRKAPTREESGLSFFITLEIEKVIMG